MIYIGENEISGIYLGDSEITGIYCGELQLYPTNLGTLTGIAIENLTWVTDIEATGGTATSANCSFSVYAYYDSGKRKKVNNQATITGSLVVPATSAETREMVGTLTLTASYSGFTDSDSVDVYQKKYTTVNYITSLTFVSDSWIDTGIIPTLETRTEMYDIYYPQYSTYQVFWGANNSDTNNNWYRVRIEYPVTQLNAALGPRAGITISYPIQGNFYFDKVGLVYEHTDLTTQTITLNATTTNPIIPTVTIGAAHNLNGTVGNVIHNLTVGEYKMYESGVLVADFKPALDENNIPCYYDEVTSTYKYNGGNGTIQGNI